MVFAIQKIENKGRQGGVQGIMPGSRQVDVFLSKDPLTGRAPAKEPSPAAASDEGNDLYTDAPNNTFFRAVPNCLII